jgi:protein TonB
MKVIILFWGLLTCCHAYSQPQEDLLICKIETEAQYPGGAVALDKHFSKIRYPKKSKKEGVSGVVFVQYVIDTSGNIQEAKILRGVSDEINREALRLVYSQKKWIPATQNGRKVKAYRKRELLFTLQR